VWKEVPLSLHHVPRRRTRGCRLRFAGKGKALSGGDGGRILVEVTERSLRGRCGREKPGPRMLEYKVKCGPPAAILPVYGAHSSTAHGERRPLQGRAGASRLEDLCGLPGGFCDRKRRSIHHFLKKIGKGFANANGNAAVTGEVLKPRRHLCHK